MNSETLPGRADVLTLQRTIAAEPKRVFNAWTSPEVLSQWWAPTGSKIVSVVMDVTPGGHYRLTLHNPQMGTYSVSGAYETIQPYSDLSFTWRWDRPDMDIGQSLVSIRLRPVAQGTDLTLSHARLPHDAAREAHQDGWTSILDNLTSYLANPTPGSAP